MLRSAGYALCILVLQWPQDCVARQAVQHVRGDEHRCIAVQGAILCNDPGRHASLLTLNGVKVPLFEDYPIAGSSASLKRSGDRLTVTVTDLEDRTSYSSVEFENVSRSPRARSFTSGNSLKCKDVTSVSIMSIDLISGKYRVSVADSKKIFRGAIRPYRVGYRKVRFHGLFSVLDRALRSANLCAVKW